MDGTEVTAIKALAGADLSGVTGLILLVVMVILPAMWKVWNWSKETSAQGLLYSQLSELVQSQRKELDDMYKERNTMQNTLFDLKSKVEKLESAENTVEVLKLKLDQKDLVIAERDSRIAGLLEELLKMKDRVHSLEMRLKIDEEKFCDGCQYKNVQHMPVIGERL